MKSLLFAAAFSLGLIGSAYAASIADELIAADRAFNKMAQEVGVAEAFAAYLSDDARMLSAGAQPALGLEAANALMSGFPANAKLIWNPVEAVVSGSGDLGFTWGRFKSILTHEDGTEQVSHGKYVTIWQRQESGEWKAVLDIGNTNPPPKE